jgi:uncharacterized protein
MWDMFGTSCRSLNNYGALDASDAAVTSLTTDPAAGWFQHIHDAGLVWASALQGEPLIGVIMASWGIAFVEYCMAVPANRLGSAVYTTAQLKTIQEIITLLVFAGFSILYLKEPITWNYAIGFVLVAAGAFFIFRGPL